MGDRRMLALGPSATHAEVGRWLSALDDGRSDTIQELGHVTEDMVDAEPSGAPNSIGTLLYHTALIELDWIADDVLGWAPADWPQHLVPLEDRDEEGILTVVRGESIGTHLDRMAQVRAFLHQHIGSMSVEDFHAPRVKEHYDVTPAWVIHHLLQHEAEHRAHIAWVRDALLGRLDAPS